MRDFQHALHDMLAAVQGIEIATERKSLSDYQSDWRLKHAVQRAIEIISEASRALPEDIKALRPEIPWPQISHDRQCAAA